MSRNTRYWLIVLVFIGLVLRLPGLFGNTFQADEALFASWARLIAVWREPLLVGQVVDKPPLLFYLQAGFYPLLGPVEFAARMPNFVASLLLIPLAARLAWRLFGEEMVAVLTAAFITFSPIAIQYSPTAFTDPLLVTLLTAAFLAASQEGKRAVFWSGLLFGLALLTKHQALLFLPFLAGLLYLNGAGRRQWMGWLTSFGPMLLLLVGWELARNGRFTLWQSQLDAFGGLRIIHAWELWPRLSEWGEQWGYLIGSPILAFGILLAVPLFLALLIHDQDRPTAFDQLFVLFVSGYFVLHWLLAVPVWDRYILPLVPLTAVILGRFLSRMLVFVRKEIPEQFDSWLSPGRVTLVLPLALLGFQGSAVWQARAGELPIGGQPTADHGAAEIAQSLFDMPYGTVLYDHWYSWHWRYHLFDKGVYVSWFPYPAALVDELEVFGGDGNVHFIALPDNAAAAPVKRAVSEAGFALELRQTAEQPPGVTAIQLYEIVRPDE
jgi:4-amino-4-deoxy-L-arabinose transferase-like glycosyltransferase